MFICFDMNVDENVFTTIDTSDFSVEDLSQETIIEYQNSSGDKVKMFDASLLMNEELGDEATKAVLYKIDDCVLYMLVIHLGSDYTLYAETELDSDEVELSLDENEDLVIFDLESEEETVISLVKGDN